MIIIAFSHAILPGNLAPRSPFNIPLIKLKLGDDENSEQLKEVRVEIDGNQEYALIRTLNDIHMKHTRKGAEKTVYSESPERAYVITDFEARHLSRTVKSFIQTLDILERDLKRGNWDRCRYLDAYLPKFLVSFYYLSCAARNSPHAFPPIGRIPDSKYDVSLSSPKSDKRIDTWREQKDHIIKLRIITKELAHQLKRWQKKELNNRKRNAEVAYSGKAEEAYALFIRVYFNLKPPARLPIK